MAGFSFSSAWSWTAWSSTVIGKPLEQGLLGNWHLAPLASHTSKYGPARLVPWAGAFRGMAGRALTMRRKAHDLHRPWTWGERTCVRDLRHGGICSGAGACAG